MPCCRSTSRRRSSTRCQSRGGLKTCLNMSSGWGRRRGSLKSQLGGDKEEVAQACRGQAQRAAQWRNSEKRQHLLKTPSRARAGDRAEAHANAREVQRRCAMRCPRCVSTSGCAPLELKTPQHLRSRVSSSGMCWKAVEGERRAPVSPEAANRETDHRAKWPGQLTPPPPARRCRDSPH